MPLNQEQLQKDAIISIDSVGTLLRNAIEASLPVAPNQHLTIAIPEIVIDLQEHEQGSPFVYDVARHAMPPTTVRQSEARLVDGMMPIANIMIGNTGKSVVYSYLRSLDRLVPTKTIGPSPQNKRYNDAMEFLRKKDPNGKRILEIYWQKRIAWTKARSAWNEAKIEARQLAEKRFPPSSDGDIVGRQKQFINDWSREHCYTYSSDANAAWMDCVVNGRKDDVEVGLGVIDFDYIMSRIETAKEALRNSTIPDQDGPSEVYGVSPLPNRWATYCKRRAEGWHTRNGQYTPGQLDAEIARMSSLLDSYLTAERMVEAKSAITYPVHGATTPKKEESDAKAVSDTKTAALYKEQGNLAGQHSGDQIFHDPASTKEEEEKVKIVLNAAQEKIVAAGEDLRDAQHDYDIVGQNGADYNRLNPNGHSLQDVQTWLGSQQDTITKELDRLKQLRADNVIITPIKVPVITGATAPKDSQDTNAPHGTAIAAEGSELANATFNASSPSTGSGGTPPADGSTLPPNSSAEDADPWTKITFSYSAADVQTSSQQSSGGMKVGGLGSWGLWSVGGSYSHDESHSLLQSDLEACDISVSFLAMVVNIMRPWMYGELFSDIDLEVADGVRLSPGPLRLHKMISEQTVLDVEQYGEFPAYPASFILAADTAIEFKGPVKHIKEHFESHRNSGGASDWQWPMVGLGQSRGRL